ncbi:MAG: Gfo/Idh/MocA family oxidoreductase [Rhodospirillales bacterium]
MINVAVIGLGWWGKKMAACLQGNSDKVHIKRGIDLNPDAVKDLAAEKGFELTNKFEDALTDPDIQAVILCTPHSLHEDQVARAAAAGKHVFCEKPLGLTRQSAINSVEVCERNGLILGVGHERRFERPMQEIERYVTSGALGTIMHAEANFSHDILDNIPLGDWRTDPKDAPAAAMTAMGIHMCDAYVHLFGPAEEVCAMTAKRVLPNPAGDEIGVQFRFKSGATGFFSAILKTPYYGRFCVFGSNAWVEVRDTTHPEHGGKSYLTLSKAGLKPETRELPAFDAVKANVEAFADAIEGKADYPMTRAEKINNIAALEAIVKSANTKQVVAVDSV